MSKKVDLRNDFWANGIYWDVWCTKRRCKRRKPGNTAVRPHSLAPQAHHPFSCPPSLPIFAQAKSLRPIFVKYFEPLSTQFKLIIIFFRYGAKFKFCSLLLPRRSFESRISISECGPSLTIWRCSGMSTSSDVCSVYTESDF